MPTDETHYMLIIHGTWSSPAKNDLKWYQKGSAFAEALTQRLKDSPLAGAVWRDCADRSTEFAWSGENTHEARLTAAERLCQELLNIRNTDASARIHFVAHSHGGNVLLKALELYAAALTERASAIIVHCEPAIARARPDTEKARLLAATLDTICSDYSQDLRCRLKDVLTDALLAAQTMLAAQTTRPAAKRRLLRSWITARFRDDHRSHRIGRVVFLGTPFLHKQWHRHMWRICGMLMTDVLAAAPAVLAVGYTLSMAASFLLSVLFGYDFPGLNPFYWSYNQLYVFIVNNLMIATFMSLDFLRHVSLSMPRDVNLYHDHWKSGWAQSDPAGSRIPALVITAAQLDEALLALSAKPLVEAYLVPTIRRLTAWHLEWDLPLLPSGSREYLFPYQIWVVRGGMWLRLALTNVLRLVAWPISTMLRPLLRAYLRRSIRKVIVAQATGLPPHELDAAGVAVRTDIGVPDVFDEGTVWDVAKLAAGTSTLGPRASTPDGHTAASSLPEERFAFLWAPDVLTERLKVAYLWPNLKAHRHALERERAYRLSDAELVALQRACLVIEEKFRELSGAVQLAHSGYYGHEDIIDAVATFLITGQRPNDP